MMVIKKIVRNFVGIFDKLRAWSEEKSKETIYLEGKTEEETDKIVVYQLWDYIQFKENTQAFHLTEVIGFDEWIDMEEIRRRIKELFSVEYKNERSLYPYIKTLVDINLLETSNIGGRRKWRKRELLFKIEDKKRKKEVKEHLSAVS